MRFFSWVPMSASMPHRCANPPKTTQPPWIASTRAAGQPRPCWLSSSIYVKRISLTSAILGTPACAGAWEDKQQLEFKPCCLPADSAIPMPGSFGFPSREISYEDFRDFIRIPKPQPRSFDPSPMTRLSGFLGPGRRNLQG
jgi:hypothetical protein